MFVKLVFAIALAYVMLYFMASNSMGANQWRQAGLTLFIWATIVEVLATFGVDLNICYGLLLSGFLPSMYFGWVIARRRWFLVTQWMPTVPQLITMINNPRKYEAEVRPR